jgi:hypothetical protein
MIQRQKFPAKMENGHPRGGWLAVVDSYDQMRGRSAARDHQQGDMALISVRCAIGYDAHWVVGAGGSAGAIV